jgi:hypothetical protein
MLKYEDMAVKDRFRADVIQAKSCRLRQKVADLPLTMTWD